MNRHLFVFLAFVCGYLSAPAQQSITIEDFTIRQTFAARSVTGINWMNDGKYYSALDDNKVMRYDVTTGQPVETVIDGSALATPLEIESYSFSADETKVLLLTDRQSIYRRSFRAQYFVYDREAESLQPLSAGGPQSYATFSPDGSKVAFVRENNLFYVTLDDMEEQQVTTDGKFNAIINGTTDWVYEEEFSFVVGFAWSPDGNRLAYYRFDESEVREYNLQFWGNLLYPLDYRYKYPKAGERNSKVAVWIYELGSGDKVLVNTGSDADVYIPRMQWTSNPNILSVLKLDRLQNHMQVLHADAASGQTKVVLDEKTDTYFDIEVLDFVYLDDGSGFIRMSEHDGHMHLYLHDAAGKQVRQLTSGPHDVTEFVGLDQRSGTLYYMSTGVSPLERHLYSIGLNGRKKTRISTAPGVHEINMSPDFRFYIDHHSDASRPAVATLYQRRRHAPVKVLERNEALVRKAEEYGIVPKEFFTFTNEEGTPLNGFMLKPDDFDPGKQYPVVVFQYSGPGSQVVQNSWAGGHFYFHQLLVQRGYIVAFIDPRGTGGRGAAFKKVTYKQLGKYELEDHLAGARYLASLDYIDGARMAIWGWSYGGYMSSLAMTRGAGLFKLGIAVAPVTNWRFYDTIYTERYLQTPQRNAEGYDVNSPLSYADRLEGKFLLIHGTGDDNVHVQNSIVFQNALVRAGKQFESFFYPDQHHGIAGGPTRHHLYTMMLNFIEENL